jgi:hypothetical protein
MLLEVNRVPKNALNIKQGPRTTNENKQKKIYDHHFYLKWCRPITKTKSYEKIRH